MTDDLVQTADAIASRAHEGQVDKAGAAYIDQPRRLAARVASVDEKATALLHGVIEDSSISAEELLAEGIPEPVVQAVVLLSRKKGQSSDDYYLAIRANPLALAVELASVDDNTEPTRLAVLDEPTRARLLKDYAHAYCVLCFGIASKAVESQNA